MPRPGASRRQPNQKTRPTTKPSFAQLELPFVNNGPEIVPLRKWIVAAREIEKNINALEKQRENIRTSQDRTELDESLKEEKVKQAELAKKLEAAGFSPARINRLLAHQPKTPH